MQCLFGARREAERRKIVLRHRVTGDGLENADFDFLHITLTDRDAGLRASPPEAIAALELAGHAAGAAEQQLVIGRAAVQTGRGRRSGSGADEVVCKADFIDEKQDYAVSDP